MREKYFLLACFILLSLIIIYLGSIIYAFACSSEKIDKHTLNTMLQGSFSPPKEIVLNINNTQYHILLPKHSGELNKDEYLIPVGSWNSYMAALKKNNWDYVDQTGTLVRVKNKSGDEFNISVRSYTGAYLILRYSTMNK